MLVHVLPQEELQIGLVLANFQPLGLLLPAAAVVVAVEPSAAVLEHAAFHASLKVVHIQKMLQ